MPRLLYAMNEPELQAYIAHINNISLIRADMAAEQVTETIRQITAAREETREPLLVDDQGFGHINIVGLLQQNVDPCAVMFGGQMTAYSEIINSVIEAEADPRVKTVSFYFDTPGGGIIGLEKTANVIKNMTKPTIGIILGQCCSAGLFLGSQCDTLEAEGELCETGSLGVRMLITDTTAQDRAKGIVKYSIVSENAPDKTLDPSKKSDRLKLKAHATKMEAVFINFVATGRNVTPDFVRKNFGRGATLIARDALDVGMIDKIQNEMIEPDLNNPKKPERNATATEKKLTEENSMEMTAEQLEKFGSDIAVKTANQVRTEITADLDKRDLAAKVENERIGAFTELKALYPNQSAMIDDESKKEGATASIAFVKKCADAETSRLAAAEDQKKAAGEQAGNEAKPNGEAANKDGVVKGSADSFITDNVKMQKGA